VKNSLHILAAWVLLAAGCLVPARADNLFQNFEAWPDLPLYDFGNYNDGTWYISDGLVDGGVYIIPYDVNSALLNNYSASRTTCLRFPRQVNSIGKISFYVANDVSSASFSLQTSPATNGPWLTRTTFSHNSDVWTFKTFTVNEYATGLYVRILKTAGSDSLSGFDNIRITNAPARVRAIDATPWTEPAVAGKPMYLGCTVEKLGLVSSLTVTSYWRVAGNVTWNPLTMGIVSGSRYKSLSSIPAQNTGTAIQYYVTAKFSGNSAISPTNEPPTAPGTPYTFTVVSRPYQSPFEAMDVAGTLSAGMTLISNNLWQGIYQGAAVTDPTFNFRGVSTNGVTTNTWGKTNPSGFNLPISGTVSLAGPAIKINGYHDYNLMFRFNDNTRSYLVRPAVYNDFSAWYTTGYTNSTNSGWVAHNAWIQTDNLRPMRNRACHLDSNGVAFVRTAASPDGIGEISFWYRNWSTSGSPATQFHVQKSMTGGTNASEWENIVTVSPVTTTNFVRFQHTINTRYHSYIRVLNSTNPATRGKLCVDEMLVTCAGAGVVMSNIVQIPASPLLVDSARLQANLTSKGGASNLLAQTFWRFGTAGTFYAIGMTNDGSGRYTSTNSIPPSNGDADGRMQYYLSCAFQGFESTYVSPVQYPYGGPANPTSYVGQAAISFSNLQRTPPYPSNQPVTVSVDITPFPNITGRTARVWFRAATGDGIFYSTPMTYLGGNSFRTTTGIPRGDVGPMEYYIECDYRSVSSPYFVKSRYPSNAPAAVFTYTNYDSWIAQDFDSWPGAPTWTWDQWEYSFFSNHTHQGWVINNGAVGSEELPPVGIPPRSLPYACFLDYLPSGGPTNIYIRTPRLTNDIGSVSFNIRNSDFGNVGIAIQRSADGTNNWVTLTNIIHNGYLAWTHLVVYVDVTNVPCFLRIAKVLDEAGATTGIDDIALTRRCARVTISSPMTHPGYPGADESVRVSCYIENVDSTVPAFDLAGRVYWREEGQPLFTGPLPMTRNGSYFITSGAIPGQESGKTIEYYIEAVFQGYSHFAAENHNPTYYPSGGAGISTNQYYLPPTNNPLSYLVRQYSSTFNYMEVTSTVGKAQMTLIGSNTWQGIITVVQPRTSLTWSVLGYGQYENGSDDYSGGSVRFVDPDQSRFILPFDAYGGTGAAPIQVSWPFTGTNMMVFRYNTADGHYIAKECAYQDFNQWNASPIYFSESLGLVNIVGTSNKFDTWPLYGITTVTEGFQDWPATNAYRPLWLGYGRGYCAQDALAYSENIYTTNKALRLREDFNTGRIWPHPAILTDGLDTFRFRYRIRHDDFYYTRSTIGSNWFGYLFECDVNTTSVGPDSRISLFSRFANTNTYYEFRTSGRRTPTGYVDLQIFRSGMVAQMAGASPGGGSYDIAGNHHYSLIVCTNNITYGATPTQYGYIYGAFDSYWFGELQLSGSSLLGNLGTVALHARGADVAVDNVKVSTIRDAQSFYLFSNTVSWACQNRMASRNGWEIRNGGINGHVYAVLYTNQGGGYVRTPYLNYNVGKLQFKYYFYNVPDRTFSVDASSNGSTWVEITNYSDTVVTTWKTFTIQHSVPGRDLRPYRYFRMRCASLNDAGGPNRGVGGAWVILIDNVFVYPENYLVLNDTFTSGTATNWVAPNNNWYVQGATYKRKGYFGPPIQIHIQKAITNNGEVYGPDPTNWVNVKTFTASNHTYLSTNYVFQSGLTIYPGIQHGTNYASVVIDDVIMNSWNATSYSDSKGWIGKQILITQRSPLNMQLELWRKRAITNYGQYVQTPVMSNGIYMVGFEAKVASTSAPARLEIQVTSGSPYTNYFTTNSVTISNTTWTTFKYPVFYNTNTPVRLLHTSTNLNTVLYLDTIQVSDFVERDERMWYSYNTLITDSENAREFEPWYIPETEVQTCYLNNRPNFRTPPGIQYTNDWAYVQTPRLRKGIGEITFWYRSWETDGNPPARIVLRASDDWQKAPPLWSNVLTIANVTNTDYVLFTTNIYDASQRYLRIYCSNSPGAMVCVDNVLIAQPVGSDFEIPRIRTIPTVPVYSNTARISCDIDSFLLNPSNIQIRAYYEVGTNNWGNWTSTNYVDLDQVTTAATYRTFSSTASIATQTIDTVVQFYLRCTFGGFFAHKASPKIHKDFRNPAWYYPINLNQQFGAMNPYYYVFSCSTGIVWVNELDYKYGTGSATTEYIELCGWGGAIVDKWKVQLVDGSTTPYANYPLGIYSIPSETNGYGFWVLADAGWPDKDLVFTNIEFNGGHLWNPGAIRVVRSMGAYADYVSYGNGGASIVKARYAGKKPSTSLDIPLTMVGTGKFVNMFGWATNAWDYTVGLPNYDQLLVAPGESMPYPAMYLQITDLWMLSTNTWVVFTLSGGHIPVPSMWYSTNMLQTNWNTVVPAGGSTNSNIHTQWFGLPTSQKTHFYRVRATNTPW